MNATHSSQCTVSIYLDICGTSKVLLLVPGFALNIFVLVSLVACIVSRRSKIRSNVAIFILGSISCNLVNLSLWPMTIYWKQHGHWRLGSHLCEVMVSAKHLTSSASFLYVSFITFSIYLTVVCGCRHLVNSRVFLALQLLFPLLPEGLKELTLWILDSRVDHLDPVNLTCFSFINDEVARVFLLAKTIMFLPLSLYFYAHVLHTIIRSAVFTLMKHSSCCQEMVRDLLLDLPLLLSPVILLCMNKELRNQCLLLLLRSPANLYMEKKKSISKTDEQHRNLTTGETDTVHL
ncbi:uncharacterized protein V6R79_021910 [Siganus canaliculatus]